MFFNPSLRTRNSFEAGIFQLGGHAHFLEPSSSRLPTLEGEDVPYQSERIADMARVLSRMGDAIAIRILGGAVDWEYDKSLRIINEFAKYSDVPVINMEDNKYHPNQGMADAMTLWENLGRDLRGRKLAVSWTYSPSTKKPIAPHHDFMYAASYFGPDIVFARPPEMRLDPDVEAAIKANVELNGGSYSVVDNMEDACESADVVYAKNYVCLDLLPPVTPNRSTTRWPSSSTSTAAGSPTRSAWRWPRTPLSTCTAFLASAATRSATPCSTTRSGAPPATTRPRTGCTPKRA